jgi:hypothetical protein
LPEKYFLGIELEELELLRTIAWLNPQKQKDLFCSYIFHSSKSGTTFGSSIYILGDPGRLRGGGRDRKGDYIPKEIFLDRDMIDLRHD